LLIDIKESENYSYDDALSDAASYGFDRNVQHILDLMDLECDNEPYILDLHPLYVAIEKGHTKVVEILLDHDSVHPFHDNHEAICLAAEHGHYDILKLLLSWRNSDDGDYEDRCDPGAQGNKPLRMACKNGHVKIVKMLLKNKHVDPSNKKDKYLRYRYSTDCGRLIEKYDDTHYVIKDDESIMYACENGHIEIVKLLLKDSRVNPSANNNAAIFRACKNGHFKIVKILLKNSRIDMKKEEKDELLKIAYFKKFYSIVHLLLRRFDFCLEDKQKYLKKTRRYIQNDAHKMIPYYSDAFYETYQLPDDIMHVIVGEFTFGYTTKECMTLLKCI